MSAAEADRPGLAASRLPIIGDHASVLFETRSLRPEQMYKPRHDRNF